jgi:HEPN domain-containing protein
MTREKRIKSVRNWIVSAEYDLETAEHMFNTGRYLYVVFMCHLALEKILKAHVELHEDKFPPKIHDLKVLLERAELRIPATLRSIIKELDHENIPTRYPENLNRALKRYTKQYCSKVLKQTEEALQWLKSHQRFSDL